MQIAYKHHSNHLILERIADEIRLLGLFPKKLWPREDLRSGRLMEVRLRGEGRTATPAGAIEPTPCQMVLVSTFEDHRSHGKLIVIILKDPVTGLLAEVNYLLCSRSPTIKTWLRVRNDGNAPILVETIYSTILYNLAAGGLSPRLNRTYIHLWHSDWFGDGEWQKMALDELGQPSHRSSHEQIVAERGLNKITMGMLEDIETKTTWYWQVEPYSTCYWEFGEDTGGKLYVLAGEMGNSGRGWYGKLAPGESLDTMPVTFGCVQGGRQEALGALDSHYQNLALGQSRGNRGPREGIPRPGASMAVGLPRLNWSFGGNSSWTRLRLTSPYLCDTMKLEYGHFYRGRTQEA
ncbi:MAG: hypothetical protein GX063_06595 [Firmicutes bacterium]|nr:hypothetical protein [Bacillota bacterium]